MATWSLDSTRETVHGHFSRDLKPILTIDSGDRVDFRTLDARWYTEPHASPSAPQPPRIEPRDPVLDAGHCLVGPVYINGAQPGMTLEVQIHEIEIGSWGWTVAGFPSRANDRLEVGDKFTYHLWSLDSAQHTAQNQFGTEISLNPFMGVMGMPTDEEGVLSTAPPRFTGGNMDCKELLAGTTLYLPIAVPGGLFSVGDGHAAQGDGEVCGTAIECPMERVSLTFRVHPEMSLTTPRIRTSDSWMCLGFHEDLHEATMIALSDMMDLMSVEYGISRSDAIALASLVVDMRVTQIANGVNGVHAVLKDSAIRKV